MVIGRQRPSWGEDVAQYKLASDYSARKDVLVLGCGDGEGCKYLMDRGALSVTGVDLDLKSLSIAKTQHKAEGIKYIEDDVQIYRNERGVFDVVLCFQVLENSPNPDELLANISKYLKPNGTAIITTVNRRREHNLTESPLDSSHLHEFDAQELEGFLKRHFDQIKIRGLVSTRLLTPDEIARIPLLGRGVSLAEKLLPWNLREQVSYMVTGLSYFPSPDEFLLRSSNIERARTLFTICQNSS